MFMTYIIWIDPNQHFYLDKTRQFAVMKEIWVDCFSSLSLDSSHSGDSCSGHGGPVTNVTIPRPGKQQPRHSRQPRQRSASVYRMASTFELGDEQVFKKNKEKENGRNFGKKAKLYFSVSHKYKINVFFRVPQYLSNPNFGDFKHSNFSAATYDHLFGPPTPAAVRRMKNKKFYGDDIPSVRKSKKPLPGLLSDNWLFNQSAQGDPGHLLVWRVHAVSYPRLVWLPCDRFQFNVPSKRCKSDNLRRFAKFGSDLPVTRIVTQPWHVFVTFNKQ